MNVRRAVRGVVSAVVLVGAVTLVAARTGAATSALLPPSHGTRVTCPWVAQSRNHSRTVTELANEVLARMTLREKVAYVVLVTRAPLGNTNVAVPRLCLPALTLSDGPNGLANGLVGVTQWPAEIALGATFSTALAHAYGVALGNETASKGLDAIQAPELNLARVALSGRVFETFGEDPYLAGALGAAEVEGIQSTGTMSDVKHFGVYTQETARLHLNQLISARALNEVYLAPFRTVVREAHVASLMCAYGLINGVNTCEDRPLYTALGQWGFRGFVRSDLHAALNVPRSFVAGVDVVKPTSVPGLMNVVRRGVLAQSVVNRAVRAVLETMFRFGLVTRPRIFSPDASATSPGHLALALRIAEESMVLLKNNRRLLPLNPAIRSLAVIGLDAGAAPIVSGGGSAAVLSPGPITPLEALRESFVRANVTYERGSSDGGVLRVLSRVAYQRGHSLVNGRVISLREGASGRNNPVVRSNPVISPTVATASRPGRGLGWNQAVLHVRVPQGGIYEFAVRQYGDTWLSLDHRDLLVSHGIHSRNTISTAVRLHAWRRYTIEIRWFAIRSHQPPRVGIRNVTRRIHQAVAAARRARVAVVFAGSFAEEGADRSSLSLPGDQNALISAVAAANPRTIVVVNSAGPVAMPWLHRVAAVLEAWYPGEEDGRAIAAVLSGAVDPSGRLPVTFPTSIAASPLASTETFPGRAATVRIGDGLDVGYRWYQVHHVRPLFPFGFGLSYTTFHTTLLRATVSHDTITLACRVANTGSRGGVDVLEVYVHDPRALAEPPEQLRAVARIPLAAGEERRVSLRLATSALATYQGDRWRTSPGLYGVSLGSSSSQLSARVTVRVP